MAVMQLDELRLHQTRLNREKVDLENQLEAEQEYIVNKLQKQVERLAKEKGALQQEKNDLQRQVCPYIPTYPRNFTLQTLPPSAPKGSTSDFCIRQHAQYCLRHRGGGGK